MSVTLMDRYEAFLSDAARLDRLRPHTIRAYRYELTAAASDTRFRVALDDLRLDDVEAWIGRPPASLSTIGRRAAWALRAQSPGRLRSCPIQKTAAASHPRGCRCALDASISSAAAPYRLILTILRETGMRVGEVLGLRLGDVTLDAGREALRVRELKNGAERTVVLGPTATPRSLRGLRALSRTMRGAPPHDILFRSNRGTAVSYDALHFQWAKLCAAAGLVDEAGVPRYTPPYSGERADRAGPADRDRAARAGASRYPVHPWVRRTAGGAGAGSAGAT